jgi:hypothetical protein
MKFPNMSEFIGVSVVIISLIFVGIQIRESNRATMSAMAIASIDKTTAWYVELGNNSESSAIL